MSDLAWGLIGIGAGGVVSALLLFTVGLPLLRREYKRHRRLLDEDRRA
jgi:hypothetical protein